STDCSDCRCWRGVRTSSSTDSAGAAESVALAKRQATASAEIETKRRDMRCTSPLKDRKDLTRGFQHQHAQRRDIRVAVNAVVHLLFIPRSNRRLILDQRHRSAGEELAPVLPAELKHR